jgi:hypothetical protein
MSGIIFHGTQHTPHAIIFKSDKHGNYHHAVNDHYYTYVQTAPDRWICKDDTQLTRVSTETVLGCQAYILIYTDDQTLDPEEYIDVEMLVDVMSGGDTPGYESSTSASDATGDRAAACTKPRRSH